MHSIHLNRNGMKDEELSILIEAMSTLNRLDCIILKHNEFGEKSYENILPILHRGMGDNLQEFRLVSCQTNSHILENMLHEMSLNCNLQKLGLVEAQLTNVHMEYLVEIIISNRFLQDLDLSWNELNTK